MKVNLRHQVRNSSSNAFISTLEESALAAAKESDSRLGNCDARSSLEGVPIAIKDIFSMRHTRTTCGSKILSSRPDLDSMICLDYCSPFDATVVRKLKDAGAVIIGKTNLDEFAMGSANVHSFFGPVINPSIPGCPLQSLSYIKVAIMLREDLRGAVQQPLRWEQFHCIRSSSI